MPIEPRRRPPSFPFGTKIWLGVGATLLVLALFFAAPTMLSLFRIHQNVQTMIVETPTATATTASTATPTALPTATPTALPTATATIAPTATLVPTPVPPEHGGAITVALLGTDRRPGEDSVAARSDAIMVARIDPVAQRIALLSLPRDLHVRIVGHGYGRINAAMAVGRNDGTEGAETMRATLSEFLGIPIDYYVTTDFAGFIELVDSLDGITVDVARELYDPRFPTMDYKYTEVYFPAGPQTFGGRTALTYSRIRHPDSDFGRIKRQQVVLNAIIARIREQYPSSQLAQIEAATTALRGYVQTDMPEERMLGLAWAFRAFDPETVERYSLEARMVSFGVGEDRWAELPLPGVLERLTNQLLASGPLTTE